MSRLLRIGTFTFNVVVRPLVDGGFTFDCLENDRREPTIGEIRYDSLGRFGTEEAAYAAAVAHARKESRKASK